MARFTEPNLRVLALEAVLADAERLQTVALLPAVVKSLQADPEVTLKAVRQMSLSRPGALNALWSGDAVERALAKTPAELAARFREAMTSRAERPK